MTAEKYTLTSRSPGDGELAKRANIRKQPAVDPCDGGGHRRIL